MTNPIPSSGKSAFDQSQFSIQKSMEKEATGNLASLKVKMQGGKEFELKKAVDIMVSNFEKLTPSQQSDQIYVLKERLSYIKNNAGTDQKGAGALLKAVKAYEKKFSEVDGKAITGNAFQNKICQINTAAQMNVFGIASPQSNGDVLLSITLPNAPSRFFTLKQNDHDKTITVSELGNPGYSKTIPDDGNALHAVIAFKDEIGKEMIKAKEALIKKTSDSVNTLAGSALKDIGESQKTLSKPKLTLGSRFVNFFKAIGRFLASIPKFFARLFSPAKVGGQSAETTQAIDKSKVKLLAGKTKSKTQAAKPDIKVEKTPSQVIKNSFAQEKFKEKFLEMNNWAGSSAIGFVGVNEQEGSDELRMNIMMLTGPDASRDFTLKFDPEKQTLTITDPKDPGFKREMPCDGTVPAGFADFRQEIAESLNAQKKLPQVDKGKEPVVDNFPLPSATPPSDVPKITSEMIANLPALPTPSVLETNSLFPTMLQDIKVINAAIGGSTGAKHVQSGGVDLIQKEGANGPHIVAEYNANKAYKALGVKVPEVKLYNKTTTAAVEGKEASPAQPVMLAEFVKGAKPLGEYLKSAKLDEREEVLAKIRESFVADVLLANWDVVGLGMDNILVTADGTPVRIDNGSSFEFRAQGGIKPGGGFSDKAGEILSMRDPSVNAQSAKIFGGITDKEIIWQIDDVQSRFESLLQATPQKYHATLKNRMADLQNFKHGLIQKQQVEHTKLQQAMMEQDQAVVFNKNFSAEGLSLHGVPFKATTKLPDFALIPDKDVGEPPFVPHPTKETSAGVIVMEPDGKVWIYEPKNHFGGYEHTFPKGRMEKGLTMQQTAIKEALEESGLHVEIEGFLMDTEKSTTKTRYYIARRVGGDPSQAHWEADKVKLVPGDTIMSYLNNGYDHPIGHKIAEYQKNHPMNLIPVPKANPPQVDNFPLPKPEDVSKATPVQSQAIVHPAQPLPKPPILEAPSLFPTMFKDIEVINAAIGGSTGAKLVKSGDTQFIQKTGNNAPHIVAEYNANKAYKALGVKVPEVKLYNMTTTQAVADKEGSPGKPVMLAEFIAGAKPLGKYLKEGNVDQREEVLAKMRENFVADVLLANWDVIGSTKDMDNILVTADGTPVRIDNGASFEFRAQGAIKPGGFGNEAKEIETLRDSKLNPSSAAIYSDITDKEIIDQINDIAGKMDALLSATPAKYHDALKNRMAYLQDYKAKLIVKQAADHKKLHQDLATPEKSVVFNKNFFAEGLSLNGVPFKPVKEMPDFSKIADVDVGEPPFVPQPGMKTSAGCIIMEPDGRVWIYEPKNHFGGYEHTFPKGTMEKGLTMQQTALKEAMEEAGLQVKIEGFLMDQVKTTSKTRYYIARRVGGDPAQAHWEASNVKLATQEDLKKYLNTGLDKTIADKIAEHQKTSPMKLPPVVTATPPQVDKMTLPKPSDVATATPVAKENILNPVHPLPKPQLPPEGALFPEMFKDIKLLNASIGGSTGAKLVESGGKKYVQKEGGKEGHITAEYNANKAYKALGIKVPEVKLYNKVNSAAIGGEHAADAKPVMLASFVDNAVSLDKYLNSANPKQREEVLKKIRANFVADALLANWDVIGLAMDNILVTQDGTPVRIDNGSAFEFRAQGGIKPGGFSDKATEIDSMRDAKISANGAAIFGGITNQEIVDQINDVQSKFNALLAATPAKYHDALTKRMAFLQEYKTNLITKDPSLAPLANVNVDAQFKQLASQTPKVKMLDSKLYTMRWGDIPTPEKTNLSVVVGGQKKHLHANTVDMPDGSSYIAIQAPGKHEYDQFVKLVDEKASLIVDLTNDTDKKKDVTSGFIERRYFPKTVGKVRDLTHMSVTCTQAQDLGKISVYTYLIKDKATGKEKSIQRVHFKAWPDHGAVNSKDMAELSSLIDKLSANAPPGSIMVHCRAGVGRTGTFLTSRTLMRMNESGNLKSSEFKEKAHEIILKAREQRGPSFVQTAVQLKSIYDLGSDMYGSSLVQDAKATVDNMTLAPMSTVSDAKLIEQFQKDFETINKWPLNALGGMQVKQSGNDMTLYVIAMVQGKWETKEFTASLDPSTKQINITSKLDPSDKTVMPYTSGIPSEFDAFRANAVEKMQGGGLSADKQKMDQIKKEFSALGLQAGTSETGLALVVPGDSNNEQKLIIMAGSPLKSKGFKISYDLDAKKLVITSDTDPSLKKEIAFTANIAKEYASFKKEVVASINQQTAQGFDIKSQSQFVAGLKDTDAVSQHLAQAQFKQGDWVIRFSESAQKYVVCMKGPTKDGAPLLQRSLSDVSKKGLEDIVAQMKSEMQVAVPVTSKSFGTDQEIIGSCFKGNLSQTEAKTLLESKPDGTYLLRTSVTSPDSKVLCFFNSAKQYTEIIMKPKQPSGWSAQQQAPMFSQFFAPGSFDSIDAVINSSPVLKANLKQPFTKADSEIISELNQGKIINPLMVTSLSAQPKGNYYMREGATYPGSYVFVCSAGGGQIKNIGLRPDPTTPGGWISYTEEPGKKFGSLSEVLNYPAFKEYLTTPQLPVKKATTELTGAQFALSPFKKRDGFIAKAQAVTPYDARSFSYGWGITNSPLPNSVLKGQIDKASPEELLGMASSGVSVSPEQFLAAAEKLKKTIPSSGKERGPQLTTLHDLYCRAADKFEAAGNVAQAFEARANAASFAGPAASSNLHDMSQAVAVGQQAQKTPLFPAHFSGLDTGILKGGSLRASNRTIDGNEVTQLEFKLSRYARQNIQGHLLNIQNNLTAFEDSLPPELKGKVRITEVEDTFLGKKSDGSFGIEKGYTPYGATALQIEFEGVGSVIIGNDKEFGCLYNNVKVLVKAGLPEGKAEQQVHQMLTMLGVGPILNEQRPMDEERLKMALIFRSYYPKQAIKMERTKEFYEMPLDMLQKKIEAEVPEMKQVFKKYHKHPELIEKKEIYPGKTTFSINDISTQMRAKGAYGLMAGVGDGKSTSDAADTVVLMMKNGALASQDRFQAGLFAQGASSEQDLRTGGGDHVFTRLINNKTVSGDLSGQWGGDFTFSGKYQMLYDLDVCNTGAYGYNSDEYGVKNPDKSNYGHYEQRANLPDLAGSINNHGNEIMVKNTVPPTMIRGIVCQKQADKDLLVQKLTAQGVIVDGKINGKPVDSFIHVASKFKKEMWNK
ncbi:protein-tyrosine phosphatase family protein [Estrella lausannensis]|uniref:Protein-tyrosine-phosphatase n=1 Tax=Estrella lausannensis TaxID=483423 RepID=A0A0H5DMX9_9BACT|nr:protein-tyrosine phosphatase family protein [Estrella lausannensis]CRX37546.1 hypothetical protein ELAC_0185 [Estrella lausannensis]